MYSMSYVSVCLVLYRSCYANNYIQFCIHLAPRSILDVRRRRKASCNAIPPQIIPRHTAQNDCSLNIATTTRVTKAFHRPAPVAPPSRHGSQLQLVCVRNIRRMNTARAPFAVILRKSTCPPERREKGDASDFCRSVLAHWTLLCSNERAGQHRTRAAPLFA